MSGAIRSSFEASGLGYTYFLSSDEDDNFLTIEVSQIRHRSGSILALLTTYTTIATARKVPGTQQVLASEVALLQTRSRDEYAASLHRLIPTEGGKNIDFSAVLEELSRFVTLPESAPLSVVRLRPTPRVVTPFLLDGILPARKPTILYGAGGTGKSILAAALAVAIQTGHPFLGHATRQTEVLYLDWETDEDDIGSRVEAAARGLSISTPDLRYVSMTLPLERRIQPLVSVVASERIGLVIIDSVGMAMNTSNRDSDPSEAAIRFFRALRSFDAAVLAIDHISGDDMRRARGGATKPYGSVYKWNSARNAFELRQTRDPDTYGAHLLLKHRKSNIGAMQPDLPINLRWDDATATATFGLDQVMAPIPPQPLPDQVTDVLSSGGATPAKIADLLSTDDVTYSELDVRRVLKSLVTQGKVRATSDGTVCLADADRPVVDSLQADQETGPTLV